MRTFVFFKDGDGVNSAPLGYAKQYANGRWVFSPAVWTGKRKPPRKTFKTMEAALPKWTGGLDATFSIEKPE